MVDLIWKNGKWNKARKAAALLRFHLHVAFIRTSLNRLPRRTEFGFQRNCD